MKKVIILLVVICIIPGLFAQTEETKIGTYERSSLNAADVANLNAVNPSAVGFDDRYEGVKGTPLLYDDWMVGDLYLFNKTLIKSLKLNLNVYEQSLYYLSTDNEQTLAVPNNKIQEIHVFVDGNTSIFRKFSPDQFEKKTDPDQFFEVLASGKYTFLKLSKKLFKEADYKGAYSADRRYDEFVSSTSYYLTNQEGIFIKLKPSIKSLGKLFPDQKDQIKEIAKNSGLSEGEELVIAVLKEL